MSRKPFSFRLLPSIAAAIFAGCSGCRTVHAVSAAPETAAATALPGDWRPLNSERTVNLIYNGRSMEVVWRGRGVCPIEGGRKSILLDSLEVPLDLTADQWRAVFPVWMRFAEPLTKHTELHLRPISVNGRQAWTTTFAGAEGSNGVGSWYGRVCIAPAGRTAWIARTAGWRSEDARELAPRWDAAITSLPR